MNNEEYVKWSEKARGYGLGVTKDDGVVEQNRKLFLGRVEKGEGRREKVEGRRGEKKGK